MPKPFMYRPVLDEEKRERRGSVDTEKQSSDRFPSDYEEALHPAPNHRSWPGFARKYLFHLVFLLFNVGWTMVVLYRPSIPFPSANPGNVPSPANDASPFERVIMNGSLWTENPFKGDPSPTQTAAWLRFHNLTEVAVGSEDLDALGRTSVQLTDGPNRYLAMLDVFHQLHCLDKIRIYIHRDYYALREHPQMQLIHVHHCLDSLREIVMCRGDTELVTFEYVSEERYPNPRPNPNFVVERKCKNWDAIVDWAEKHHADIEAAESRENWERKHGPATSPG